MKIIYQKDKIAFRSNIKNASFLSKKFLNTNFEIIKNQILGTKYDLSVVFVGKKFIESKNFKYRKVKKPTDILSFKITEKSGEIFICPYIAKIKSPKFFMKFEEYTLFLLIHGMLHLKGFEHGKKMEILENKYFLKFK